MERLADELLLLIFEHIPDLHGTCLTSSKMHSLALPILYKHITLLTSDGMHGAIPKLLRTFLDRPDFAVFVRSYTSSVIIYAQDFGVRTGVMPSTCTHCLDDHKEQVAVAIENACPTESQRDAWFSCAFGEDYEPAITAILYSLMPNLEYLALCSSATDDGIDSVQDRRWPRIFLKQAAKLQSSQGSSLYSLAKLRRVEVKTTKDSRFQLSDSLVYMELPTVREFIGSCLYSLKDRWELLAYENFSSRVEKIVIEDSILSQANIRETLLRCPRLKEFTYEEGIYQTRDPVEIEFVMGGIIQGLAVAKDSLESISLTVRDKIGSGRSLDWDFPIPRLDSFTRLEYLKIDSCLLFGVRSKHTERHLTAFLKIVPQSLKTLELRNCKGWEWIYVERLAQRKDFLAPRLMCVKIHFGQDEEAEDWRSISAEWLKICTRYGIQLHLSGGLSLRPRQSEQR